MKHNNDFINEQIKVINFIKKYKNTTLLREELPMIDIFSVTDLTEFYTLTIDNKIAFDNQHPYFNNIDFIDNMISYYMQGENFEKCRELKQIKEYLAN